MAIFKLEIRLDNAAFHDDDGDFSPEWQISAILDRLSQEIYDSGVNMGPKGALRDTNGNLVGEWRIEE